MSLGCFLPYSTHQTEAKSKNSLWWGLWWRVLVIVHRTCHGEVHKTKKTTSEEEQKKGLAVLGCGCYKALTLNLLTQALTSSYLTPQDGKDDQQVSNLEEGVSVLARESL
jgi:hypothetical protein